MQHMFLSSIPCLDFAARRGHVDTACCQDLARADSGGSSLDLYAALCRADLDPSIFACRDKTKENFHFVGCLTVSYRSFVGVVNFHDD